MDVGDDARQRERSRCCSASASATWSPACRSAPTASTRGGVADIFTALRGLVGVTLLALSRAARRDVPGAQDRRRRSASARALSACGSCVAAVVVAVGFAVWSLTVLSALALVAVLAGGALAAQPAARAGRFTATAVAMGGAVSSLFVDLFPNVMVSSTDAAYNLTVAGAASGSYALKVMTVVGRGVLAARAALPGLDLPRVPRARRAALAPPGVRVGSVAAQQLGVRAALGDAAGLEHDDLVHRLQPGEPVGDQERAAVARRARRRRARRRSRRRGARPARRAPPARSRASSARASAIRWRSPPREPAPAWPRLDVEPLGSFAQRRCASSAVSRSALRGVAAGEQEVLPHASCRTRACPARRARRRCGGRRRRAPRSARRRASPSRPGSRGTAAARRPAWTCPSPLGPTTATRRREEVEVDAVERPRAGVAVARAAARARAGRASSGSGRGAAGSRTGGAACRAPRGTRSALAARTHAASWAAPGRPATSSYGRRAGRARSTASSTGVEAAAATAAVPATSAPHMREAGQAASTRPSPAPAAAGGRGRAARAARRRAPRSPRSRRRQGAVHAQLIGAFDQVDDGGCERSRAPRAWRSSRAVRQPPGERTGPLSPPSTSATSSTSPAAGSSHHGQRDRRAPGDERDRERRDDAQQQGLQGVDVVHEARQQIAAAERGRPRGRQRLEAAVDVATRNCVSARERGVVTGEALAVAQQRA